MAAARLDILGHSARTFMSILLLVFQFFCFCQTFCEFAKEQHGQEVSITDTKYDCSGDIDHSRQHSDTCDFTRRQVEIVFSDRAVSLQKNAVTLLSPFYFAGIRFSHQPQKFSIIENVHLASKLFFLTQVMRC